ncbi:hypothetical protein M3J09_005686 [Ascochyta lentis]
MPGKKNTPAEWIGGRRRKLIRRNPTNGGPPRSSTLPVLNPGSAAASLVNSVSSVGSEHVKERQSEDSYDQQQRENRQKAEGVEGKMSFYPQSGAVNAPSASLVEDPATSSLKRTATDGKKKQGLFGTRKLKALDRPNNSPHTPVVTSPLPVTTPSKAAQFFGLESKPKVIESPRRGYFHDDAITGDDDALAGAERQTRFKEEDVEPDLPKSTKAGKANTNKGLRMLIPDFASPRRAPIQQATAATTRFDLNENDDDVGYSSGGRLQEPRYRIPAAPRPVPAAPKRRVSKNPKPLQRMSPITEASFEELRPAYRQNEDTTELGVISEYEYDDTPYSGPVLPRSQNESELTPHGAFKLDEDDLSPTDAFYVEDVTDEEDCTVHPGTKVKRVHWQRPFELYTRSPLQSIEDDFLDATEEEMRLEARRMTLARVEAEKQAMDAEIAALKHEHKRMKHEFGGNESGDRESVQPKSEPNECSDEEDRDPVSLRSSIDLDEEPTVHEAEVMTFTRILPGMVKLVDIPPRTKKPVVYVGNNPPIPEKLINIGHEKKHVVSPSKDENTLPASPVVTHHHHEDPDRASKLKKPKMTREESQLLVQNWISNYNSTEQRPISTRVDPDVLADQETPPAPFPKSDEALPTPPIKPRSDSLALPKQFQKHQCINNGHIFHPVDLKHIPDIAVVNSLEVRPYLQTYTGVKQHVKIPVLCEKCCEDCDENVWECEIAVCRMAVCQSCAEDMEAEWQERAVSGWKYKR